MSPPTASAPAAPTSSPLPPSAAPSAPVPTDPHVLSRPALRLEVRDLKHPGAQRFLTSVDASSILPNAVALACSHLYNLPSIHTAHTPPVRSVTLVLRDMDGVAYTIGTDLDRDHKEIHFSLRYISGIDPVRAADEIRGVVVHEMVHCYQWNGHGTCPGGLIEGVADWVRLRCGLSPPHWRRELDGKWDRGYQHTAYFLDYLESRFGEGTVRKLNERLRTERYHAKEFWTETLGGHVDKLWKDYVEDCKKKGLS